MTSADRLDSVMADLPPDLQQEVFDYAQYLLEMKDVAPDSAGRPRFYLCPVCFAAASHPLRCHGHLMIPCNTNKPEDCKPLMDEDGNFNSRAPRWFIASISRTVQSQ
jgi:hypothetical protein